MSRAVFLNGYTVIFCLILGVDSNEENICSRSLSVKDKLNMRLECRGIE
jgi:hypothetical protein